MDLLCLRHTDKSQKELFTLVSTLLRGVQPTKMKIFGSYFTLQMLLTFSCWLEAAVDPKFSILKRNVGLLRHRFGAIVGKTEEKRAGKEGW